MWSIVATAIFSIKRSEAILSNNSDRLHSELSIVDLYVVAIYDTKEGGPTIIYRLLWSWYVFLGLFCTNMKLQDL